MLKHVQHDGSSWGRGGDQFCDHVLAEVAPARDRRKTVRHPELVSGSSPPRVPAIPVAQWMLKHVQHDGSSWGRGGDQFCDHVLAEVLPSRDRLKTVRHPELVSGSSAQQVPAIPVARWMLKHVQHDGSSLGRGVAIKSAVTFLPRLRLRETAAKPSVILNSFQDPALHESGRCPLHGGC
ncbi:hypothetical protein [Sphingomonas sp. PAMC 26617]|uniref:hypothetical protein n=1 Tax=Sphingomonas sp. PAMC 26617 TaxID=1112216 RepID=UPI0012F4CB43|nr:hypothetical protein [Sphingomonas sp. PAMC 26617]